MAPKEDERSEATGLGSKNYNNLEKATGPKKSHEEAEANVEADTLVLSSCRERGELTPILALDCEYVGVGSEGRDDSLARVSVVNEQGKVVYDKFVASKERIVDFRTQVSGIRAKDLVNAPSFESVRSEVHSLLSNRTIVGHALHNDFRVLQLNIPRKFSRDIAKSRFLRKESKSGDRPSLRGYAEKLLGITIQDGEHDSIVDARVALRIYLLHKKQIEEELARYK
ncbi:unnamed protein product, partial [Mesorhabditis spiculigera]